MSWDDWFARWRAMLAGHGDQEITVREASQPMEELMRIQLDNHATIPLGMRFGSGSRTATLARRPSGTCDRARTSDGDEFALDPRDPGQQPRHAYRYDGVARQLRPADYVSYPAKRGFLRAVRCAGAWIDASPCFAGRAPTGALVGADADRPAARRLSEQMVVIRLPTFSKQNGEYLREALPSWPTSSPQDRVLIVDLRDNDGGDATFGALASWLPWATLEPLTRTRRRIGDSCVYHGLRFGYAAIS